MAFRSDIFTFRCEIIMQVDAHRLLLLNKWGRAAVMLCVNWFFFFFFLKGQKTYWTGMLHTVSAITVIHTHVVTLFREKNTVVFIGCFSADIHMHPIKSSLIMIVFSAPPAITEAPPPVLEALIGGHLSLPCVANGNPPPTITWLKDGSVIQRANDKVCV